MKKCNYCKQDLPKKKKFAPGHTNFYCNRECYVLGSRKLRPRVVHQTYEKPSLLKEEKYGYIV